MARALRPADVTVARTRQLDRAMLALHRGEISYSAFTKVLKRWVGGHDVSRELLGNESLPDRIRLAFGGQTIGIGQTAEALGESYHSVGAALSRMADDQRAQRVARGIYKVKK